jgi:hypothetical protein
MSSIGRFVLGAALLLTGASAAIAASDKPLVAYQSVQTGASTATAASNNAPIIAAQSVQTGASTATAAPNNAPVAYQSAQTGASIATTASNNAPSAAQSHNSHDSNVADKTDRYGGYDPNSTAGVRAFWEGQNPY